VAEAQLLVVGSIFCGVGFRTVFIVGTANYYNFMDGINGIAGITGLLGFALLAAYVNLIEGSVAVTGVAVCLSLAWLGFLPLNMPKARVFMGDIGSILLGSAFAGLIWLAAVLGVLAGWFGAFWVESCRLRKSVRAKIAAEFMVTQRRKDAKKDKKG
jgi:UDP-N-acetylmuramyl pentapeptide phosphotransferase/UDP-N-acetylglucosamine-1-phosphate transferase